MEPNLNKLIKYFIVLFLLTSCSESNDNKNQKNDTLLINKDTVIELSRKSVKESTDDTSANIRKDASCSITKNITDSLDQIKQNSKSIIRVNPDNCVLALLDSLTERSINEKNVQYLIALDSICVNADGYVSEYYIDISLKLFYNDFESYFMYIYGKSSNKNNCLRGKLIEALSMELSDADNPDTKKAEIQQFIQEQITLVNLSNDKQKYLKDILAALNPHMFD